MGHKLDTFRRAITGASEMQARAMVEAENRNPAFAEVRDPRAATQVYQNMSYQSNAKPLPMEWDADSAYRFAYYANIFVYRCVQITAQAIASMPFRAGMDPDKPHMFKTDARLAQLLGPPPKGPAPRLAARKLWQWSVAQYLVTGRMCWELELASPRSTEVVNIWPLVSSKVGAIPSTRGVDWFRAFEYNVGSARPTPLTLEQVFYAWRPSALDFRQPESVLQAARLDVSVAVMQDRYDYAFLRNDARPATMIVHERFNKRSEKEAFREQFRSEYGGPDNAGKTMFVEAADSDDEQAMDVRGSILVQTLGLTHRDAEFIKRYGQKLQAICIAFGTPLSKLGDASNRTFDNADAENRNWWNDTVYPLAVELQDEINLQLAPRLGNEIGWFDTSKVEALRPKPKWAPEPISSLINVVYARSEARSEFELPDELPEDFEEAPDPPDPANNEVPPPPQLTPGADGNPISALPPVPPTPPPKPVPPRSAVIEIRDGLREGRDLLGGLHDQIDLAERSAAYLERRSNEVRQVTDHFDMLEITWEAEIRRLFSSQRTSTMSRLKGRRGRSVQQRDGLSVSSGDLFDVGHWHNVVVESARSLHRQSALLAGQRINRGVRAGGGFDINHPRVQEHIESRSVVLASRVTNTIHDHIRTTLVDGLAASETTEELATRIGQVFDAADARAPMIARTESTSGYNGAMNTMFDTHGRDVAAGKEWLALNDKDTRDGHAEADGQRVLAGEPFVVAEQATQYPAGDGMTAGNAANCRCTILILSQEDLGLRPVSEGAAQ